MTTATTAPARVPRVTRGLKRPPERILAYGVEGVGKTTFGADAPRPIFLDIDKSSDRLDVERLGDADDQDNPPPKNYPESVAAIRALHDPAYRGDRMTLVIDTGDKFESDFVHPEVVVRHKPEKGKPKPTAISDIGFAKGYVQALEVWAEFLSVLDALQAATGMDLIINCHARVSKVVNLGGDDLSAYEPALYTGTNSSAAELLREWASEVFFMTFDDRARQAAGEGDRKKAGPKKAFTTGERIMYTTHQGWCMAKNRLGLPEQLPLSWAAFAAGRDAFYRARWRPTAASPDELRRMIASLAREVRGWPDTPYEWEEKKLRPLVEKAGDDHGALLGVYQKIDEKVAARYAPATETAE